MTDKKRLKLAGELALYMCGILAGVIIIILDLGATSKFIYGLVGVISCFAFCLCIVDLVDMTLSVKATPQKEQ